MAVSERERKYWFIQLQEDEKEEKKTRPPFFSHIFFWQIKE